MAQMHISREGNWGGKMFGSLQEAYDRLRAIVDSSYDGIYITDGNAVTLWVNRAYEDITGLRAEEVVGRSMWDLERDGIISKSGTLLALAQRAPVTLEQVFRTGCHALISSTPAFDDRGEISLVVTNVRDMTELRELQEKYRQTAALSQRYQSEAEYVRKQVLASADLIVADPKMLSLLEQVKRVAALDATVLLLGETGVGKEKIAKYIYKNSARKDERFLAINCGAISPTLIESELFGYERGAFTGASREGKMGLFEVADKGTVFLDEIGELPLEMQVRLLRVLQEQTVQRVGGTRDIPISVRVVAATNRDLEEMVREKTFREDLFYRLNVVPIRIPPLRERQADIPAFVDHFLAQFNQKYNTRKEFHRDAVRAMLAYGWPGNVRELKNVIERAVILSSGEVIRPEDLPFCPGWTPALFSPGQGETVDLKALTQQFEARFINAAYEKYGSVRKAAASLSMDPATFLRKRKKYAEDQLIQN